MPEFGFYKVGSDIASPLTIVVAPSLEDARKLARETIEAEGLDAVHLWVAGETIVTVRRPPKQVKVAAVNPAHARWDRMAKRKAEGASLHAIAQEFGLTKKRAEQIIGVVEERARMRVEQPNRAALSMRARNTLRQLIDEPEDDVTERDRLLPARVAALSKRRIHLVGNLGKSTIAEIEVWLWDRGHSFG